MLRLLSRRRAPEPINKFMASVQSLGNVKMKFIRAFSIDAAISEEAVNGLNRFAQSVGLLAEPVSYERVVAVQFRDLWRL